jgi:plastocyanin
MRSLYLAVALGIGVLGFLSVAPQESQAHGRRFYAGGFYGPVVTTYYYAPCPPVYYAPPAYYYPAPLYRQPAPYYAPYMPSFRQPRPTAVTSVGAYDDYFEPRTINVVPGTTVRWVNYGKHIHTITSNDGLFDSGDLPPGASYAVTFTRPGAVYYYCRHHTRERMQGTVMVGPGGAYGGSRPAGY